MMPRNISGNGSPTRDKRGRAPCALLQSLFPCAAESVELHVKSLTRGQVSKRVAPTGGTP